MPRSEPSRLNENRCFVHRSASRRLQSAGSATTIYLALIAAAWADTKRDLRGFSLGMTKDLAARHASGQCRNFGTISFQAGSDGELFFDSARERGRQFSCSFDDGSIVSYSVTPRTRKIYKLEGAFVSQMDCDELLGFTKETFGVDDAYARYVAKPTHAKACSGWTWRVSPGYSLEVWIDDRETGRFYVTLTDSEIVRENELSAGDVRKQSSAKPRL